MRTRLDEGWRFHRGDAEGAETPAFDDSGWRTIEVPHDWSIEDVPGTNSPIHPELSAGKAATGHAVGGTGWYRRTLHLGECEAAELTFEAVYMNADVWVNGNHVAFHPYGYTPFTVDLTPYIHAREATVAVRVRNEGHNARWYTGSGIYRPVWLRRMGRRHLVTDGVSVSTEGNVVHLRAELVGEGQAELRAVLRGPDGQELDQKSMPAQGPLVESSFEVEHPQLWYPWNLAPAGQEADQPLYTLDLELWSEGKVQDSHSVRFGFRTIEIDATKGMRVNDRPVLLMGGCVHHDNGILGARAFDRAEERKVEILRQAGYNAIRTSHNPPSTAFLDACDRLGMLVIDEVHDEWVSPKVPDGYTRSFKEWSTADAKAMVRRDRNHPCVAFWSIGNEIIDAFDRPDIAKQLREAVLVEDPTRPVTAGVCTPWWTPGSVYKDWETSSDPAFEHLDLGGYNYLPNQFEPDHERHPDRVMMGTESYALEAWEHWDKVRRLPYVIGDFVWTAMDYIGESGIGQGFQIGDQSVNGEYPFHLAVCGDIDLIGYRKPQSFYREALWAPGVLHATVRHPEDPTRQKITDGWHYKWGWRDVESHWNWPGREGQPLEVEVSTSYEIVEVRLNGRTIDRRELQEADRNSLVFQVPYEPGVLEVVGFDGQDQKVFRLETTGPPTALRASADRTDVRAEKDDLCFVSIEAVDDAGRPVPNVKIQVQAEVDGSGRLLALGSADPMDTDSVQDSVHRTHDGLALAVIQPTGAGEIRVTFEAEDLEVAEVSIRSG